MHEDFDIVIYGATSFAGEIIVSHMMNTYGESTALKWALAGRSEEKINNTKAKTGALNIPHIIADSSNEGQLLSMVRRAKVIITTVGPYALYGEPLLKACVQTGTDYCDLTGEVQWYRRMLVKYEKKAIATGARIVLCSGFDSIPSDMGVYFLQNEAKKRFGKYCVQVKNRVQKFSGGASGGSAISFLNVARETAKDATEREALKDPYSLCPKDHNFHARQNEVERAAYDSDFESWIGTFIMAKINTRVVHRSNALLNNAYGNDFLYDEARLTGNGPKGKSNARKLSWGFSTFMYLAGKAPTRWALSRLMPKPGEGPTPEQQEKGKYVLQFFGRTRDNQALRAIVTGDRDPGYGSTAKIIAESAICLSDIPAETQGGFWTPSTLYGQSLIKRLMVNAGVKFEILE